MKYMILCAAMCATKWFTLAPAAEDNKPEPPSPPAPKGCQCGCGRATCKCGKPAIAKCPAPRIDHVALTEALSHKPAARLSVPEQEIWLFAPSWCFACKQTKTRLGTGDQRTRLIVKEQEAHFTPASYPVFYDPKGLKQWSGQPKGMDELRRNLGMPTPMTQEPALGTVNVGSIGKEEGEILKKLIGKPGPINLPNERIEYDAESVIVILPEKFAGVCTHSNGVKRAEFTTQPSVKYGVLSQSCKAITISGDMITLELPWAPDVSLTIEAE